MHSFDRFYIVTKLFYPLRDLKFSKLKYNNTCVYLDEKNSHNAEKKYNLDLLAFCKKIEPYVTSYKRQIKSYNDKAHNI